MNEKTIKTKATAVKKAKVAKIPVKIIAKIPDQTTAVVKNTGPAVTTKKAPSAITEAVKVTLKGIKAPATPIKKAVAKTALVKRTAAAAVETPLAKTFVANNAIAKKAVAKKAVAKKAVAKKAVAKKAVAKKAVAKKSASKALSTGNKPSATGLPARAKAVANILLETVLKALDDMKAKDVVVIDVRNRTSITDDLVFASGTSTRHVKSLADSVAKAARDIKMPPIGVEGEKEAEWVLVDLADVVVHVMLPKTREFYALERMWSTAGDGVSE